MTTRKLKLSTLSKAVLKDKEMDSIFGGDSICTCSCAYAGQPGGSSSNNNMVANLNLGPGGHSVNGCNQYFAFETSGTIYYTELYARES